jgi:hypothetical protein
MIFFDNLIKFVLGNNKKIWMSVGLGGDPYLLHGYDQILEQ